MNIASCLSMFCISFVSTCFIYVYIYIYGCLLFLLSRNVVHYVPLCRPVPATMVPTCAGPHVPTCAGHLCRDGLFASLCRAGRFYIKLNVENALTNNRIVSKRLQNTFQSTDKNNMKRHSSPYFELVKHGMGIYACCMFQFVSQLTPHQCPAPYPI